MPYALCSSTASANGARQSAAALALLCCLLPACSSMDGNAVIGSAADSALGVVGLKRANADTTTGFDEIPLRIHAARNLNAGADDKGTALVVRIYKLRGIDAFLSMPPEAAMLPVKEKEALGADLIEVREIVLTPNQQLEVKEKVSREAGFIAMAGQFRNPAASRWRVAFDRGAAAKSGVLVAAHACAFSVGAGAPIGWKEAQATRLAAARCGAPDDDTK
ncbi:type VI secretion system lipoprotein TssJ [Niveibacterium umoris]|nr:type VI secretion system lipoprotein TssJ [Niveibacterium umoris]